MRIEKNYIRYAANGYTGERKISAEDKSVYLLQLGFETQLIPFAMDTDHNDFIIFMIERKEDVNLFVWVHLNDNGPKGKKVRITAVNELMQYTKWTDNPMDVSGKYPDDILVKAIKFDND